MLYRNDSAEALTALERQRLGNYGNESEVEDEYDFWEDVDRSYDEWGELFE